MTPQEIQIALAAPFPAESVKFLPKAIQGNRALALPYVDARSVMDRLDDVLGIDGWEDEYHFLANGTVVCELTCRINGMPVSRTDVGAPSEQPDVHDKDKAAVSDALKRAAVKFGIGRYLYRLKQSWCDWDAQNKCFKKTPVLPASALPKAPMIPKPPALPTIDCVCDAEYDELNRLLTETQVHYTVLLEWASKKVGYQIERLQDLPASLFYAAASKLEATRASQVKQTQRAG